MRLMSKYTSRINYLENCFKTEDFGENISHMVFEGATPVFISAPHSVSQLREGRIKASEYMTGVITELLHEKTGCYCAFKTHNCSDDANFDEYSPYKEDVISCIRSNDIKFLLDLHIMAPYREHEIEFGTHQGENIQGRFDIINDIKSIFTSNKLSSVEVDKIFPVKPTTVSSTIAKECGIFTLQIEINKRILNTSESIVGLLRVVKSLRQTIDYLNNQLIA